MKMWKSLMSRVYVYFCCQRISHKSIVLNLWCRKTNSLQLKDTKVKYKFPLQRQHC